MVMLIMFSTILVQTVYLFLFYFLYFLFSSLVSCLLLISSYFLLLFFFSYGNATAFERQRVRVFLGCYLPELGRTGARSGTSEVYSVRDQLRSISNSGQRYDLGPLSMSHEQRSWTGREEQITKEHSSNFMFMNPCGLSPFFFFYLSLGRSHLEPLLKDDQLSTAP